MSIKITVDGKVYDDITTITVGGKVLTLTHAEDSGEPETPIEPEVTLTSISATYSGGAVEAGTSVNYLTGIKVTAHYSNGTSASVTGYTLSGTIAEGSNTITVTYSGKTTTFTVTGVAKQVTTYSVSAELDNITSSNNVTVANEGENYIATLTANNGYMLPSTMGGSITVTMGGANITSEVYNYNSGKITIASVTGNIVIRATAFAKPTLIEDGLESFFDFRNPEISINGNYKYYSANKGNGAMFHNNVDIAATEQGMIFGNNLPYYTNSGSITWGKYYGTNNQYTIVVCYYAPASHGYSVPFGQSVLSQTYPKWYPKLNYINTSGTSVGVTSDVAAPSATGAGFIAGAISVGANKAVFATQKGAFATLNASDYEDYSHFDGYADNGYLNPNRQSDSITMCAIYNRALSTDEMVSVLNYMMTEVAS